MKLGTTAQGCEEGESSIFLKFQYFETAKSEKLQPQGELQKSNSYSSVIPFEL